MNVTLCERLRGELPEMFECVLHRDYVRVRTPFLYPDGGVIDVFVKDGDSFTVTDLGEALGWLKVQSVSGQRSPRQQRLLQDVCQTLGVEVFRGQLFIRGTPDISLSSAIVKLGQAAVRVSDIWFTTRTRSVSSVTEEVSDLLSEQNIPFEQAVKLPGRSGRDWNVDFQTRTPSRSALVFVLASGSRPGARRVAEHVVAGWHDLSPIKVGNSAVRFVSLFDDTIDVWSEEDFRLVESISDIGRWSRPDEFVRLISDAA